MRLALECGSTTHETAVELGIRGVPVDGGALLKEGVEATLAPLRARGLEVCQIGAFGFNPLHPDRAYQLEQIEQLDQLIDLAPSTGCPYIAIGPGNHHPSGFGAADPRNFRSAALDALASDLAPLCRKAEAVGVKLTVEPYLKSAIHRPDAFLSLKQRLPSPALRITLDVSNFYDFAALVDPQPCAAEACSRLAGHYGLVHLKEIALAEGFHLHAGLVPLGKGLTDWGNVLRLAAPHIPADSWVMVEHCSDAAEARASIGLIRSLLPR